MNNEQFRRLVKSSSSKTQDASPAVTADIRPSGYFMAPRSVKVPSRGNAKEYKSSAPKGVKLAEGYRDRTKDRRDDQDEKATRIAALEESLKKEEIDEATFIRLRDEITGGEVENTHLVKGLDWKLLERIRRGEKVDSTSGHEDDEFEELEKVQVQAVAKESTKKIGQQAPARKTRDEILAELKASRKRAAPEPLLGSKFRKIGESRSEGENGRKAPTEKPDGRSTHKAHTEQDNNLPSILLDAEVVVPKQKTPEVSDDDDDIYADLGDDYDPLAALGESDDSGDEAENSTAAKLDGTESANAQAEPKSQSGFPRNYFNEDVSTISVLKSAPDPSFIAAIAAASKKASETEKAPDDERLKKRAAVLAQDRDVDDMDMGFGSSRFEDGDDGENPSERRDHKKKKRTRKRKGDKNSAADVMRVIEGRK
jgi:hypothetical protein